MTEHKPLSASRIKTLRDCSWLYWCKYVLKLPRDENSGSLRGSVCHIIFDCLGKDRHNKTFLEITEAQNVWASASVTRLIKKFCKDKGICDEENLALINTMILEGLNYDFFAKKALGNSKAAYESYSELNFDLIVKEGDKDFRILGFIDKLFLFKGKKMVLVRDFKTSKSVYTEEEIEDNIQNLIYRLAVKKLYPKYKKCDLEFVFVKFSCGHDGLGVIKTPHVSDEELDGFEYYLTEIQKEVNNFDEKSAKSNFAFHGGFPEPHEGFCKKLLCGFAKYKGHLKKDGNLMWHCPVKFAFDYYQVSDKEGNIILGLTLDEKDEIRKAKAMGYTLKRVKYPGCPVHNAKDQAFL